MRGAKLIAAVAGSIRKSNAAERQRRTRMALQARCKCGNGVFIVMVENVTDKTADIRYECTLCDHEVVYEADRADAEAFCAGLNGTFGTDAEGDC